MSIGRKGGVRAGRRSIVVDQDEGVLLILWDREIPGWVARFVNGISFTRVLVCGCGEGG